MARWAIGDVQGCCAELNELLARLRFNADRDVLWFTGDLVNRGPESLAALRRVHALADNVIVVLGNHDLHLLLSWLIARPLAHLDPERQDLLVHAGLVPQWDAPLAARLAAEVARSLQHDPRALLESMYGDQPDQWDEALRGMDRLRFVINVLTRIRVCTAQGRIDLKQKGAPAEARAPWQPWFALKGRASAATRVIFGHWSALGFYRSNGLLGIDTGCVWGGALTAVNLDDPEAPPLAVPAHQKPGRAAPQE